MTTRTEATQEIECTTERVRQRQEHHLTAALKGNMYIDTELHVACQGIERRNHAFRETGRAGGIVEGGNLVVRFVRILQLVRLNTVRIKALKFLLNPFGCKTGFIETVHYRKRFEVCE